MKCNTCNDTGLYLIPIDTVEAEIFCECAIGQIEKDKFRTEWELEDKRNQLTQT